MKRDGMGNQDIIRSLQSQGFSSQQISEAMSQSDIKSGIEGKSGGVTIEKDEIPEPSEDASMDEMKESILKKEGGSMEEETKPVRKKPVGGEEPEIPGFDEEIQEAVSNQPPVAMDRFTSDQIQAMAESIIDERWQEVVSNIGDINIWKSRMEDDVSAIKQEILRTNKRLENLQTAVLGKVEEYNKSISGFSSDVKAMEKVFEKILEPLTANVKELSKITKEWKSKK